MTSFKSKMFSFMIRKGHLFRGKIKKETFDFNTSIAGFRERCEKGAGRYAKIPEGISIKEQSIEGMRLLILLKNICGLFRIINYFVMRLDFN